MSRRVWCAVASVLALGQAVPAAWAAPPAPDVCTVVPDYGGPALIVSWSPVEDALGYRIYRATFPAHDFVQVGGDVPAGETSLIDRQVDPAFEYLYTVRAFDERGESPDSGAFRQNLFTLWPDTAGRGLLHNWNEVLDRAGSYSSIYHRGVDIQQQGDTNDRIVFPRGGVVARVGSGGFDDNYVYVEVRIGDTLRYDSFNHLEGDDATALGHAVGDVVRAGQTLGFIGSDHFTEGTVDWVDHVHFFIPSSPLTNVVDGHNPLKIFAADAERDPRERRPGVWDHFEPPDGTVLFHRQGAPAGEYLSPPLGDLRSTAEDEGNVDIHVEIADDMNGGAGTTQTPTSIAYWIEGAACGRSGPAVASAERPYVFLRGDAHFLGYEGVELEEIVDPAQNLGPYTSHDGIAYPWAAPPEYGWDDFQHFVVTNAGGMDGEPSTIDGQLYWNTNAAEDGSPRDGEHANFAGRADAGRAQDARFPDGTYTVFVRVGDLIDAREDRLPPVRVENFPPAVRDVRFDPDLDPGGIGSHAVLYIEFSEAMATEATRNAVTLTPLDDGPEFAAAWDSEGCVLKLDSGMSFDPSRSYRLTIDAARAQDLSGKRLDGQFGTAAHDGLTSRDGVADSVILEFDFVEPREVERLTFGDGVARTLAWTPLPGAATYSVIGGSLADLQNGSYGSCLATDIDATSFRTGAAPARGGLRFYLVRAESTIGRPGPIGVSSHGVRPGPICD